MSLLDVFARAHAKKRPAFIPYVMAGDPDLDTTHGILAALARAGADAIELGVPYGDPLADGPTVAAAGQRALANGVALPDVFALVERAKASGVPPIVLFTYFNPVYQYGIDRFTEDAAAVGVAAAIVPDVTFEESAELCESFASRGMEMPLLIAPSTPRERASRIADRSTGFIYVVSRMGVTGAGAAPDTASLRAQLQMLRSITQKPLAAGFGVSRREHVQAIAPYADGIIVGSALIDAYSGASGEAAAAKVEAFAKNLFPL